MDCVWLIDVNGVLSAPQAGQNWGRTAEAQVRAQRRSFRLVWAPQLLATVARLAQEENGLTVAWCSSWCPWADELEALWGLPRLPRMLPEDQNRNQTAWSRMVVQLKQDAAQRVLDSGAKLIWTDDRAVPLEGPLHKDLMATKSLALRPDSLVGLIPAHMNMIERYVNGIRTIESSIA